MKHTPNAMQSGEDRRENEVRMTMQERNTTTTPTDFGRLRLLLDEQEALFVRLDALSKCQHTLVDEDRTDELLGLLNERQAIIGGIEDVAAELQPFRSRWEAVLEDANPEQRDRLTQQVERLADLASRVAARDETDRKLMERRRDALACELAGADKARGAVAAYGGSSRRPAARFQDREA